MEIIFRHPWLLFIGVTFAHTFIIKSRVKQYIDSHPDLKAGYNRLFKNFLIFGNIPYLIMGIGDLTGSTKSIFDYVKPQQFNPIVLTFHASTIILLLLVSYWIYFRNGAAFLEKHPGLLTFGKTAKPYILSQSKIKLKWALQMFGGLLVEIVMWNYR